MRGSLPRPTKLLFGNRTIQGPYFHLTSVEWGRNRVPGFHTHDYPEIFWVTRGEWDHVLTGGVHRLSAGDVVLMRSTDAHQLRAGRGPGAFRFTNLALCPRVFAQLRSTYGSEVNALYDGSDAPRSLHLGSAALEQLEEEARALALAPHQRTHLDHFVLGVWTRFLATSVHTVPADGIPSWLQRALIEVQEPEVFSKGAAGLVALCGRCHEHVSRECRRHLGKTPTQVVNEARLRRAAKNLRLTAMSVIEIALECGFDNPAQFHRIFRQAYGTTPNRYRRA